MPRPNHHLREGDPVVIERGPYEGRRGYVAYTYSGDRYAVRFGRPGLDQGEVVVSGEDLGLIPNEGPAARTDLSEKLAAWLGETGWTLHVAVDDDPQGPFFVVEVAEGAEVIGKGARGTLDDAVDAALNDAERLRVDLRENRRWTQAYVNDLPDDAFLWIDEGRVEYTDERGRSHPLDTRKLPYRNRQGNVDYAHLKNALARIARTDMPAKEKARVREKAERLFEREFGYAAED
jgi:hypothetical protein